MKAVWNGQVIAEAAAEDTIEIEGNTYFPPHSLVQDYFSPTDTHSTCPWKGEANYYDVEVDGNKNPASAWYYPVPKEGSEERVGKPFANFVAFWNGIEVSA